MEYTFTLRERRVIAQDTMAFFFDKNGQDYSFKPGQHTDWTLINPPLTDDEGNTRTFSFVSNPVESYIEIATRLRDTAFKNSLKMIPLGSQIKAKEPMGRMTLHQDAVKPAVFLIGGIGITPVMSVVRTLYAQPTDRAVYLFYANNSQPTAAFYDELEQIASQNPSFHFIPTFTATPPAAWTGETGRIDETMIKKYLNDPSTAVFYSSGPPAMVSAMVAIAEKLCVGEEFIRTEDFAGY